jgi:hypothetical protein
MGELTTMVQTAIRINGNEQLLAQNEDIDDLKAKIRTALHAGGDFVDFVVAGNRRVNILITPSTEVVITLATVAHDPRDDGDETRPFGGYYDF